MNKECRGCDFFSSDSCVDEMWYICDHPEISKEFTEGKGLDSSNGALSGKIYIPKWCPKKTLHK